MEAGYKKNQTQCFFPLATLAFSAVLFSSTAYSSTENSADNIADSTAEDSTDISAERQIPDWAKNGALNLYFENDLFAETDQNYTNGIRLSYVSGDVSDFLEQPPEWIAEYNNLINPLLSWQIPEVNGTATQRNFVVTFGQQIYTPSDINRTTVDPDDRPYAGWLYLGVGYNQNNGLRMDSTQLNVGIVGPAALGQEAQDFIHDARGFAKFAGWDNQLRNEPGIQFIYETKRKQAPQPLFSALQYDFIYHAGFSLGNVATYLNGGGEIRVGFKLPSDFGTSTLRPGGDNTAPGRYKQGTTTSLHLFASADARLVAHDIFLDGNTFRDSHSIDKEYLVGDVAVGVAMLTGRWKIAYAQIFRSKEFKGQPDSHSYGSLSATYNF